MKSLMQLVENRIVFDEPPWEWVQLMAKGDGIKETKNGRMTLEYENYRKKKERLFCKTFGLRPDKRRRNVWDRLLDSMPDVDHARHWISTEGHPVLTSEPYQMGGKLSQEYTEEECAEGVPELLAFADKHNLVCGVSKAWSWWYPKHTALIWWEVLRWRTQPKPRKVPMSEKIWICPKCNAAFGSLSVYEVFGKEAPKWYDNSKPAWCDICECDCIETEIEHPGRRQ